MADHQNKRRDISSAEVCNTLTRRTHLLKVNNEKSNYFNKTICHHHHLNIPTSQHQKPPSGTGNSIMEILTKYTVLLSTKQ